MDTRHAVHNNTAPLLRASSGDALIINQAGEVNVADFLGKVNALAKRLPALPYAINLCGDRENFLLAFCATLVAGQANLLPANHKLGTQQELARRYPDCYVIGDGCEVWSELQSVTALKDEPAPPADAIPEIPLDQLALISFTSGSSGEPGENRKTWHALKAGTRINVANLLDETHRAGSILATVPSQHMYGIETAILLPLLSPLRLVAEHPLFPQDVCDALAMMKGARTLVSTPFHMQALLGSSIEFPKVDLVLSATAPLHKETAEAVAKRFDTEVREIYGCSEVGCIARRNPITEQQWTAFSGFTFSQRNDLNYVDAEHLSGPVELQDALEFVDFNRFILHGRATDMLNIAGKRGSLVQINQLIQQVDGVRDVCAFTRPTDNGVQRIYALIAGSPDAAASIRAHLKQHLDGVFIPRRMGFVEQLPRTAAGKLPKTAVEAAFAASQSGKQPNE